MPTRPRVVKPEPPKQAQAEAKPVRLMIARFPYGGTEESDVGDFVAQVVVEAKRDPRIDNEVFRWKKGDTPIPMLRNLAVNLAKQAEVDFLLMVDNDMKPDAYLASNPDRLGTDPLAEPFFASSFDFAYRHRQAKGPCVIGAPYCGPPPHENIYVFRWATKETDNPNVDCELRQFAREEAAERTGIEEVAALPTGVILFDMRAFDKLAPPYSFYEWTTNEETEKASTEDVTITRDLSMICGVPQYCNWNAWAGHWKKKCVGKPRILTSRDISRKFRDAAIRDYKPEPESSLVTIGLDRKHTPIETNGTPAAHSPARRQPNGRARNHQNV